MLHVGHPGGKVKYSGRNMGLKHSGDINLVLGGVLMIVEAGVWVR